MHPPPPPASAPLREVIVGQGSRLWRALAGQAAVVALSPKVMGHRDVAGFAFTPNDRVWLLSVSRRPAENAALIDRIAQAGVRELIYVSSSSTIVLNTTRCYAYPRVKHLAELHALKHANAKILTLGLVYGDEAELPAGANVATACAELAAFMAAPDWPDAAGRRKQLFRIVHCPFASPLQGWAHRAYGALLRGAGPYPCLLRPLDAVLRLIGARSYGYVHLSNHLWISTTS